MRCTGERLSDDAIHEELTSENVILDGVSNNKLMGVLWFYDVYTDGDTATYEFDVDEIIDSFIEGNICGKDNLFDDDGVKDAKIIIANLQEMINKLNENIPGIKKPTELDCN